MRRFFVIETRTGGTGTGWNADSMGPVGFEPTTKGFTLPRRFHREWTISSPVHQSGACGCGMLQACYQGRSSPQVVSAPSAGVPAARLRVAMDTQVAEGFPEFIPSTSRVSARRHLIDESPALTAVLQAQRPAIVAAPLASGAEQSATAVAAGTATMRERLVDRALEPGDLVDAVVTGSSGVHGAVMRAPRVAFVRCACRV